MGEVIEMPNAMLSKTRRVTAVAAIMIAPFTAVHIDNARADSGMNIPRPHSKAALVVLERDVAMQMTNDFRFPMTPQGFGKLDERFSSLRDSRQQIPSGDWALATAYTLFAQWIVPEHITDGAERQRLLVEGHLTQAPTSPTAIVLKGVFLKNRLWRRAGVTRWYDSPFLEAPKFKRPLDELRDYLLRSAKHGQSDPHWHYLLASTYLADLKYEKDLQRVTREALQKFPGYFPIMALATNYYSPHWHNKPKSYGAMLSEIEAISPKNMKPTIAARIHWHGYARDRAANLVDHQALRFRWEKLKASYEAWYQAYPSAIVAHRLAHLACEAGDIEMLEAQISRLEKSYRPPSAFEGVCRLVAQLATSTRL